MLRLGKKSSTKSIQNEGVAGSGYGNATAAENSISSFRRPVSDPEVVERVRVTIKNAHVFKLPPRQSAGGWRGADWREKVWQGNVKVVDRGEQTAVILVDRTTESVFAVCPVQEGAVDRCVDSSRYFVLRIENEEGRHMFIGMAFNERNDAFDFNTALEDSRRERELEKMPIKAYDGPTKDYSLKEGQKIHVNIKRVSSDTKSPARSAVSAGVEKGIPGRAKQKVSGSGFLAPPSKDTPSRARTVKHASASKATHSRTVDADTFQAFPSGGSCFEEEAFSDSPAF